MEPKNVTEFIKNMHGGGCDNLVECYFVKLLLTKCNC